MKKGFWLFINIFLFVLLICFENNVDAQDNVEKLDARLKMLIQMESIDKLHKNTMLAKIARQKYLNVFVKGDVGAIRTKIENAGGFVNTVTQNIVTAQIPLHKILNIASLEAVSRIQLSNVLKIRNSEAVKHVRADKVHAGHSPLNTSYTGKDVIVGIIDTGIDWRHKDFRGLADTTKSRILYIWDQNNENGLNPTGFNYGTEWTKEQIEDEIDGIPAGTIHHTDDDGHGTHVTATAAGNSGLAPGADIIVVKFESRDLTKVIDAVNYIYTKADNLGRPVVINISGGMHICPHDGSGLSSLALDQLINSTPGRALCAAAGNEGEDFIHFGDFQLNGKQAWTYYYGVPSEEIKFAEMRLYLTLDNACLDLMSLAIGVDKAVFTDEIPTSSTFISKTKWRTFGAIKQSMVEDTLFISGKIAGKILISGAALDDSRTEFYIVINDFLDAVGSTAGLDLWRFCFKGQGKFNAWSETIRPVPDPENFGLVVDENYHSQDNKYTVGTPGDAKEVIAVGSYLNRSYYVKANGDTIPALKNRLPVGKISGFSSHGPSIDKRVKPEIVAPGEHVFSAHSSNCKINDVDILSGNKKQIMYSGTSMSSPVVAGCVALLLERYPHFTNSEIRSRLFDYTLIDDFVKSAGNLPNNIWGFGKLDIFGVLTEQKTSVDEKEAPHFNTSFELRQNYPNPFNPITNIVYILPENAYVKLIVYNILGQEINQIVNGNEVRGVKNKYWNGKDANGNSVSGGIYFFKMSAVGKTETYTALIKGILLK